MIEAVLAVMTKALAGCERDFDDGYTNSKCAMPSGLGWHLPHSASNGQQNKRRIILRVTDGIICRFTTC
jgi:hypothetical protein